MVTGRECRVHGHPRQHVVSLHLRLGRGRWRRRWTLLARLAGTGGWRGHVQRSAASDKAHQQREHNKVLHPRSSVLVECACDLLGQLYRDDAKGNRLRKEMRRKWILQAEMPRHDVTL